MKSFFKVYIVSAIILGIDLLLDADSTSPFYVLAIPTALIIYAPINSLFLFLTKICFFGRKFDYNLLFILLETVLYIMLENLFEVKKDFLFSQLMSFLVLFSIIFLIKITRCHRDATGTGE